jgi:adenosylcobinamide-GDP ribazoletransferase
MSVADSLSRAEEAAPRVSACSRLVVGAVAALQFLTIMPPLVRRCFSARELGRAVGYFPLVGIMLGGILAGLGALAELLWPPALTAALVLLAWVILTGALHVDGFLDSCDGLFGGHTADQRLRIMQDEHVGAFAVVGGTLLLLIKWLALSAAVPFSVALLLSPLLGRWCMVQAIILFPYARPKGLGRDMKDHAGWRQLLLATVTCTAGCWIMAGPWGLLLLAIVAVGTWGAAAFVLRRLPGLTGDIYGALCEIIEVAILLAFAARAPA